MYSLQKGWWGCVACLYCRARNTTTEKIYFHGNGNERLHYYWKDGNLSEEFVFYWDGSMQHHFKFDPADDDKFIEKIFYNKDGSISAHHTYDENGLLMGWAKSKNYDVKFTHGTKEDIRYDDSGKNISHLFYDVNNEIDRGWKFEDGRKKIYKDGQLSQLVLFNEDGSERVNYPIKDKKIVSGTVEFRIYEPKPRVRHYGVTSQHSTSLDFIDELMNYTNQRLLFSLNSLTASDGHWTILKDDKLTTKIDCEVKDGKLVIDESFELVIYESDRDNAYAKYYIAFPVGVIDKQYMLDLRWAKVKWDANSKPVVKDENAAFAQRYETEYQIHFNWSW